MANIMNSLKGGGAGKSVIILAALALVVAALVVVFLWGYKPGYQVLYSNLSPSDSGAVIDKLREQSIPYRVEGSSISVPAEKVYETRMELAGQGLPQGGGVGFEIFDKTSFGVTQFVQKVNYQRAMQGELSRTISQLADIESARVHLVIPARGVFLKDIEGARASIVVKLRPGRTLSHGNVDAIVHLVANSFENLKTEDVVVVDTAGRMYTRGTKEDDGLMLVATQLENRVSMEKDLEFRIQTMLEKAVGSGNVVARVAMIVDTKRIERTEESYDPESQVVRSEQITKEKSTGGAGAGGVPGVLSNVPGGEGAARAGTPAKRQTQAETINYEINKVVSRVIEPVNTITSLSVSVLINGSYDVTTDDEGEETREYVPRSAADIAIFTGMVKGAVGFSEERGDKVSVVNVPFETDFVAPPAEPEGAPMIPPQMLPSLVKYASMAIVSIVAILFLFRPMIRKLLEDRGPAIGAYPVQASLPGGVAAGSALEAGFEMPKQDNTMENIKKVVRENPAQTAMVIKNWVKEK